ncbi:MAG: hypothetical protein U9O56_07855, partial [Campylobacterota bacterium]|nr:hypothetical protein [Campylobacterota bacterium]
TNSNKIIDILNSMDIEELYNKGILKTAIEIVKSYEFKKPLNSFFDERNKEKVLLKIQDLFSHIKGSYIQKTSGKKINNVKMVSLRFYNTLLNKLNFKENIANKLYSLKNKVQLTQQQRLQRVEDEIVLLNEKINSLKFFRSKEFDRGVENLLYENIIIGLEFFHNDRIRRTVLDGYDYTYFELLQEKQILEDNMDADIMEYNHFIRLHRYTQEAVIDLFYHFIKLERYVKVDNFRFSKIGIIQSLEQLAKKIVNISKLGGAKRRQRISKLQNDFGNRYKEYLKIINSLTDEKKQFIFKKVLLLKKHTRLLKELEADMIQNIFNDENLDLDYHSKLKELPAKYITKEEHKDYSNYYEQKSQLESEIQDIENEYDKTYEYIDSNRESDLATKFTEKQRELEELEEFYNNWEYPEYVQSYINNHLL